MRKTENKTTKRTWCCLRRAILGKAARGVGLAEEREHGLGLGGRPISISQRQRGRGVPFRSQPFRIVCRYPTPFSSARARRPPSRGPESCRSGTEEGKVRTCELIKWTRGYQGTPQVPLLARSTIPRWRRPLGKLGYVQKHESVGECRGEERARPI